MGSGAVEGVPEAIAAEALARLSGMVPRFQA